MKNLISLNRSGMSPDGTSRKGRHAIESIVSRFSLASLICLCMLTVGSGNVWGVDFSFTSAPTGWPSSSRSTANGSTEYTYTVSGTTYSFLLGAGCYVTSSVKLLHPKSKSTGLPKLSGYKLTKVVGVLNSSGNLSTKSVVSITTDGSTLVSGGTGQTWSTMGGSYTYNLTGTADNTRYYLTVSSAANCQIQSLSLTYTSTGGGCDKKVTLSYDGDGASHGEFVLKAGSAAGSTISEGGTTDNCGSGTTVVALCPQNVDTHWHLEASNISASGKTGSITSDGNGNFLISYTQGSNISSTVSVTFTEDTHYTVTWMNNGSQHATTEVYSGEKPTFPSNPSSCDGTSTTFVGWTPTPWSGKLDDVSAKTIYTDASAMPAVTGNVTYYAVFAKAVKSDNYQMLYDVNNFISGEDYLIDCYYSSTDHVLKAANYNSLSYQQVSYNSWTLPSKNTNFAMTDANFIWKITSEGNGHYSMYNATTGKYLVLVTVSSYKNLILSDTKDASFIRTVNTDGDDTYKFESTSVSGYYIYCNGSYYKAENEGDWLYLYKRVTTYSKYITNCCTELGTINGSVNLTQLATPDPTKLKASWTMNAETGIVSYTLEVYDSSDNLVKTINNYTSGSEITGLTPCTEYYVKLYTVSSGGEYCDGGLIGTSSSVTTNGYTLTVNKSNVTLSSGSEPTNICSNVSATYEASTGYNLPSTITVTNAGEQNTGWTWNSSTGVLTINKTSVTGNVTVTITGAAQSNFINGETVFIQADSKDYSAWKDDVCVKAWFNASGAGGAAQTTYWLFDATDTDAGKKLFAAIVPSTGDLNQVTLQRFQSDCLAEHWYNNNGTLTKASSGGVNTFRSYGSADNNVAWNGSSTTLNLYGSQNSWASSLATFADQGNGVWTATVSNYTPDATSKTYKIRTSYNNGWIGNTGDNEDATLSGMIVGSTYNVTATLDIKDHSLEMSKTFVKGTVHFDMQSHGSDISDLTNVAAGSKISAPSPAPTDAAYDFGGWYKEPACTNAWNFASDVVNETMTLYAKWTPHNFTITYEGLEGASNTNPTSYTIETATIVLANPGSRTGYTFSGWTLGGSPITQIVLGTTGDKTITATWSINTPNLAVSAADHVVITATPASELAIAEGANRNVNYNKTVTLNCAPEDHWSIEWDVYKTGESSTKVAITGSGDGATFTMPDYAVTVSAVMTEAAYKTVCFKNNGEDIDGYASVKVYVDESPVAPTLTDGTSGDACDPTSDKHYGWTKETWTSTIATQSEIDARTGTEAVYAKSAALPVVAAGDPATITYHAVWAAGSGSPAINSTLIAKWDKQALTASTAVKAKDKDGNMLNDVTMTSSHTLGTAGTYCYQNTITSTVTITISGLDFSAYDKGALSFYARGSQQKTIDVDYSTGGAYSDLVTTPNITKKEQAYEISNIPKATTSIKLTYVYGTSGETFYFGTVRAYGVNNTPSYEFTELTDDNTSGWTGSDWDGYYIITGNSSTKALRSSGICGFSDFATVSAVDSKISTSDIGLIFRINYSSENSGFVVQGLGGGDYMATEKVNSDAFSIMTTTVAYLYGMSYNSLAHTSSTYLKWSTDRFGIYSSSTGVNPTLYKMLGAAENFLTTCCTQYDISGASTSGTAVTGGTLTSTDNSACEDREVKITANVSDGYRFDSWTITAGGSPVARKDGSAEIEDGNPIYVFDMPAADVTVSAAFTRVYPVTYDANGGTGEMIDVNSPYAAGDKVTVLANTFTKAGYNFDSWSYSPAVSVTDGKFDMPSSDVTITAQWTAKPLNNIILAQTEAEIYDQQYVQIDVTYDPADIVTKGYTLTGPALTKVVTTGSTQTQLKISATKAGVIISEVVSETVSIKANADETKTASVVVTIKPLPRVHFTDIIHNVVSGDVVATISENALVATKTTPTHADVAEPGSGNACEKSHLHLVGWIDGEWEPYQAYMDGTGEKPTDSAIIGATGYFYAPNADIDLVAKDGKTYYAVWANVE